MGRKKIFTSADIKALRDKSRDLSRVNKEREVLSEDIFSWYVPGKERDFTSSSWSQEKNNSDKPSYHHYNYNYNYNNNNNNTLKVIYSSMLNNYQYSMWCLVRDFSAHDEIFHLERKKKNWMCSMIYSLVFFHMAKFWLCCCSWSCKIRVCWPVG